MTTDLTIPTQQPATLAQVGQVADKAAARHKLGDYRSRKAPNTIRRQDADLALFAEYLAEVGISAGPLATEPGAWEGVTAGLVEGFARWMLAEGYAAGSVNVRLSTVKTFAALALGALAQGLGNRSAKRRAALATEATLIGAVKGYAHKEARNLDERRAAAGVATRQGAKKAEPVSLTTDQAQALKAQPDTPQGRRDRLILCLLLDHGLRVGELAGLAVGDLDLQAGELRFYRRKVDKVQTHRLEPDALQAARAYLAQDAQALGPLLRASRKDGRLTSSGMAARRISERVRTLGQAVGVAGLSAHDLRHFWATQAARNGTPLDRLQQAGGWASLAMPARYIEAAAIANQGVKLG
jgi:integrase